MSIWILQAQHSQIKIKSIPYYEYCLIRWPTGFIKGLWAANIYSIFLIDCWFPTPGQPTFRCLELEKIETRDSRQRLRTEMNRGSGQTISKFRGRRRRRIAYAIRMWRSLAICNVVVRVAIIPCLETKILDMVTNQVATSQRGVGAKGDAQKRREGRGRKRGGWCDDQVRVEAFLVGIGNTDDMG